MYSSDDAALAITEAVQHGHGGCSDNHDRAPQVPCYCCCCLGHVSPCGFHCMTHSLPPCTDHHWLVVCRQMSQLKSHPELLSLGATTAALRPMVTPMLELLPQHQTMATAMWSRRKSWCMVW